MSHRTFCFFYLKYAAAWLCTYTFNVLSDKSVIDPEFVA